MKPHVTVVTLFSALVVASAANAQLGGLLKRAEQAREQPKSLTISEEDEQLIGAGVSARVRQRYGVAQDQATHTYVTLVGTVLAQVSARRSLPWTFIVLDTDGVNAFAAPGGYIHITRGALALLKSQAELTGVLAHQMTPDSPKHTATALCRQERRHSG